MKESIVKIDVISSTDEILNSVTCQCARFNDPYRFLQGGIGHLGFTLDNSVFEKIPYKYSESTFCVKTLISKNLAIPYENFTSPKDFEGPKENRKIDQRIVLLQKWVELFKMKRKIEPPRYSTN